MSYKPRSRSPYRPRKTRFTDAHSEHAEQDLIKTIETVKNAQTTKVDRKLYVGNLPSGITHSQLVDLLNTALINKKLNCYPGHPVLSAWISQDGHYAFVEFRSIEEANLAFSLNNYPILGQNLKVGRPKTYTGSQPASAADRNTLMGGYTMPTVTAYAADASKQGPLKPVKVSLSSEVLCLERVLDEAEVNNPVITEELEREFRRLGEVNEVYIPTEGSFLGNVYVEYNTILQAKTARKALNGKLFKGRVLEINFVPLKSFKEKELSNTEELQVYINS